MAGISRFSEEADAWRRGETGHRRGKAVITGTAGPEVTGR
jgi:hypothetical protein